MRARSWVCDPQRTIIFSSHRKLKHSHTRRSVRQIKKWSVIKMGKGSFAFRRRCRCEMVSSVSMKTAAIGVNCGLCAKNNCSCSTKKHSIYACRHCQTQIQFSVYDSIEANHRTQPSPHHFSADKVFTSHFHMPNRRIGGRAVYVSVLLFFFHSD